MKVFFKLKTLPACRQGTDSMTFIDETFSRMVVLSYIISIIMTTLISMKVTGCVLNLPLLSVFFFTVLLYMCGLHSRSPLRTLPWQNWS